MGEDARCTALVRTCWKEPESIFDPRKDRQHNNTCGASRKSVQEMGPPPERSAHRFHRTNGSIYCNSFSTA